MDHLPIDTSHPAVREYLALVRLQVLTPLSLLINIACVATCAFVTNPSISKVAKLYPTSITPHIPTLGAYVAALCLGQIGYCVLLVLTKREETKRAFVSAVGLFLPLANICMALWAICFVMRWFIPCTVLQGLILLLLLFSNIALYIYHPLEESNALAIAFVHAPLRFFFVLPFTILFELSLFIAIGLTYFPSGPGEPPRDYSSWHALVGFGVLLGTNLVSLLVITTRRDLVWCIAATWIVISVWTSSPKPAPVYITALVFTVLHPLALIVSFTWNRFCSTSRQERQIVLPGDDATHPGLYNSPPQLPTTAKDRRVAELERGPREIEVDDNTWG